MRNKLFLFIILLFITNLVYASHDKPLPNPKFTTGLTLNVNKSDICVSGYSKSVRNVTASEKNQVYQEYNMQPDKSPCPCEVDHLISLELGGSNEIINLWPQPYTGQWNAHKKDRLEDWLHEQVCKGNMTLQEAQDAIRNDWTKAYTKYGLDKFGNKGNITKIVH